MPGGAGCSQFTAAQMGRCPLSGRGGGRSRMLIFTPTPPERALEWRRWARWPLIALIRGAVGGERCTAMMIRSICLSLSAPSPTLAVLFPATSRQPRVSFDRSKFGSSGAQRCRSHVLSLPPSLLAIACQFLLSDASWCRKLTSPWIM